MTNFGKIPRITHGEPLNPHKITVSHHTVTVIGLIFSKTPPNYCKQQPLQSYAQRLSPTLAERI